MRAGLLRGLTLTVVLSTIAAPVWAGDPFATLKITRVAPGTVAAPFELKSLDGRSVQLTDFKGKAVVVNFWATWCGPCREEIPGLIQVRSDFGARGLEVIGVAIDSAEKAQAFAREFFDDVAAGRAEEAIAALIRGTVWRKWAGQ